VIVWNWPFAAAAGLMAAVFLLHLFAGGREAVRPLLDAESLPKQARMTLYYAWHLVSAGLLAAALVFLAAALRPEWIAIGWAAGLMVAVFALVSIVQTVLMRLPITMVPQWIFFAPIAALAIWGSMG
jgi:glucan phosphoethanolaminetransferase (alkaline phosphatase superfamily)